MGRFKVGEFNKYGLDADDTFGAGGDELNIISSGIHRLKPANRFLKIWP